MKIKVFFLYVFILLLGGRNNLYSITNNKHESCLSSSHSVVKNKPLKFTNNEQTIALLEETDLDLEEDFHNGNDVKDVFLDVKYNSLIPWNSTNFQIFALNYSTKSFKIFPFFWKNLSPIYISLNVLRI
jgi:hypothetical protein